VVSPGGLGKASKRTGDKEAPPSETRTGERGVGRGERRERNRVGKEMLFVKIRLRDHQEARKRGFNQEEGTRTTGEAGSKNFVMEGGNFTGGRSVTPKKNWGYVKREKGGGGGGEKRIISFQERGGVSQRGVTGGGKGKKGTFFPWVEKEGLTKVKKRPAGS